MPVHLHCLCRSLTVQYSFGQSFQMCSFLSTVCPPSLRGHLGKCLCPACRVLLVWCKEMPFPSQLTHRATKSRFRMAVRTPSFSRPQHRLLSKVALTRGRWLRTHSHWGCPSAFVQIINSFLLPPALPVLPQTVFSCLPSPCSE